MNWLMAELRKLVTLPSLRLTAAFTLGATALLASIDVEPIAYTQTGFLVLGALAATESQTTTLLAMPRRLHLHAAKAVAVVAITLPLAAVASVPANEPAIAATYLALTTVLAFAAGTMIRNALATVLALLGTHVIAGPLLRGASDTVTRFLPDTPAWDATRGFSATVAWTAAALLVSAYMFHRRDAV